MIGYLTRSIPLLSQNIVLAVLFPNRQIRTIILINIFIKRFLQCVCREKRERFLRLLDSREVFHLNNIKQETCHDEREES